MNLSARPYFTALLTVSSVLVGGIAYLSWLHIYRKRKGAEKLRRRLSTSVSLVSTPSQWEECFPVLQAEIEKLRVVGIDCEWVPKQRVALLQIATQSGYCVLVRLCQMAPDIPRSLRTLLADKSILKVGVAVKDDAKKLVRDYCLAAAGCVDLRHLMARVPGVYKCRSLGLQGLARTVLNEHLSKEHAVRCGNWEARLLSQQQIDYAATDAIVAVDIFVNLVLAKTLGKDPRQHPEEAQAVTFDKFWTTARSLCQGIVDVGYKHHRNAQAQAKAGKHHHRPVKKQGGDVFVTRKRPLWDNCQLVAPDGQLLCTCDSRKAAWYISKGLGDKVSDDPVTVKLRFEPSNRPKSGRNYYLQDKENMCVVCGATDGYARKFVVPQEYRKYFPHLLKAHTSHDVLLLCPPCHVRSSEHDAAMRLQLAEECGAPLDSGPNSRVSQDHDLQQVRSAGRALQKSRDKMPGVRVKELEKVLYDFYGVPEITPEILDLAANIDPKQVKDDYESHAKRVVIYMAERGDLLKFQARWRRHFVTTMHPKFLPAFWSVDYVPENWSEQMERGDDGQGDEGEQAGGREKDREEEEEEEDEEDEEEDSGESDEVDVDFDEDNEEDEEEEWEEEQQ